MPGSALLARSASVAWRLQKTTGFQEIRSLVWRAVGHETEVDAVLSELTAGAAWRRAGARSPRVTARPCA